MAPTDDIRTELDNMKGAIATLSDGKWDKNDVAAIATMLSSAAGLILAIVALLMQIGIIGAHVSVPAPAEVEAAAASSSGAVEASSTTD